MLGLVRSYSATLSKPHILTLSLAAAECPSSFVEIYSSASAAFRKVCSGLGLFAQIKATSLDAISLYLRRFLFHFFVFLVCTGILIILFFDFLCLAGLEYRLKLQTLFVLIVYFLVQCVSTFSFWVITLFKWIEISGLNAISFDLF